jgi:hypothetical protein
MRSAALARGIVVHPSQYNPAAETAGRADRLPSLVGFPSLANFQAVPYNAMGPPAELPWSLPQCEVSEIQ